MKRILILTLIICISLGGFAIADNLQVGDKIGDVLYTDIKTFINGEEVECFNINGKTAVYVNEFGKADHYVTYVAEKRAIVVTKKENEELAKYKLSIIDKINLAIQKLEYNNSIFTQRKEDFKHSKDLTEKAKEEMFKEFDNQVDNNNKILEILQNMKLDTIKNNNMEALKQLENNADYTLENIIDVE